MTTMGALLRSKGNVTVLRRALMVLIVLVGAATVLGLLDRVDWRFELASIFRLQHAVVLAAAALAAAVLRPRDAFRATKAGNERGTRGAVIHDPD